VVHLEQLAQLKNYAKDASFQRAVMKVKQENKLRLAQLLEQEYGVEINPASMFDIQVLLQTFHFSFLYYILDLTMFAVLLIFITFLVQVVCNYLYYFMLM
jgi:hypothetical protein